MGLVLLILVLLFLFGGGGGYYGYRSGYYGGRGLGGLASLIIALSFYIFCSGADSIIDPTIERGAVDSTG